MRLAAIAIAALLLCGCVERRIYLRSDPPGADVYIDGEYVGRTRDAKDPEGALYANFIYYGTREYTFRKPGFATHSGSIKLEAPWYEYPPVDFFAEVLAPFKIVDEHEVNAKLAPALPANLQELYAAARAYREPTRPEDRYEFAAMAATRPQPAGK
ncbi:MAG: PEGA domain-containing protein [Planctomycetes bacterium]|nr:PEGA domain-containing protein [Planctomycetota bacterium]